MTKEFVKSVLTEYAEENGPNTPDPMSSIIRRIKMNSNSVSVNSAAKAVRPRGSLKVGAIIGVPVALTIVLLAFFMWPAAQAKPVSAAEILAKVEGVENGSVSTGLQTAHLTESYRIDMLDMVERKGKVELVSSGFANGTTDVWYRAPGDVARTNTEHRPDGTTMSGVGVDTPAGRYLPDNPTGVFSIRDQRKDYPQVFSQVSLDQVKVLETSYVGHQDVYSVTVIGTDVVLGRPAYLIQKDIRPEAVEQYHATTPMWKIQIWVDQQYFVKLKSRTWQQDGSLFEERDVTGMEFNVAVNPELFEIGKAQDQIVADQRTITEAELKQSWQEALSNTSVTLYAPQRGEALIADCGPLVFSQRRAYYDADRRVVAQPLMHSISENRGEYMDALIVQGPVDAMSSVVSEEDMNSPAESITIGSATGRIYLTDQAPAKASVLVYDIGQTRIAIYSWQGDQGLNKTALTAIANSLQEVSAGK